MKHLKRVSFTSIQVGFRPRKSCTGQALQLIEDGFEKKIRGVVFVDLTPSKENLYHHK